MRVRTWMGAGAVAHRARCAGARCVIGLRSDGFQRNERRASRRTSRFVHGIPGVSVDIYVNGTKLLSDFRFKTVASEYPLNAGVFHIAIRPAGAKTRVEADPVRDQGC